MRRFSSKGLPKRAGFAAQESAPAPAPAPPPPIQIPRGVKKVHHYQGESARAALLRLCCAIGSAGRHNTQRGRWFRITRFQAEVMAVALVYVLLCILLVLVRTGVVTVNWFRGQ